MPLPMFQKKAASSPSQIKHVIAVAAGKGGVGKSSVSVNLALALQSLGWRVGIFDADIYGPSIRKMLKEEIPPSQQEGRLIPAIAYGGLRIMSMAYFRKENEAAAIRAPIANGIIKQFIQNVEWGNLDCLLIDFPPGTGDVQLTLSQYGGLSGTIIVTTPQEVALIDVKKAMDLFVKVRIPILGIVENMSHYTYAPTGEKVYLFGKGGGLRLAESSKLPFLGEIPLEPKICHDGDHGYPFIDIHAKEHSPAAQAFINLGAKVIEELQWVQAQSAFEIHAVDNAHFQVQWKDGSHAVCRISHVQSLCPCAACRDEATGERRESAPKVLDNVQAVSFKKIGSYALKIEFSSGCSLGLYDDKLLREAAVFS